MQSEFQQVGAPIATYTGAGVSVVAGLSTHEWNALGVMVGVIVGVIGLTLQIIGFVRKAREHKLTMLIKQKQLEKYGEENESGIGPNH